MNKVNVIIKATNACNLRCTYCYNSDTEYCNAILPIKKFEKFLILLAQKYNEIDIIWHGGEPLLVGIDYMTQAMDAEARIRFDRGVKITNKIQTNGTLIDKKWAEFFKKHDIKPGLSFDGLNNEKYRQGTDKVLRAMDLLKKEGVRFGTLAVVADNDYDYLANYKFFVEKKISTDFSPIFKEGNAKDLGDLEAEKFADEMIRLFDYWITDKTGVGIRLFTNYMSMTMGKNCRTCTNASCIGNFFSIYPNGDIFNCGRSSMTNYPFGNIDSVESVEDLFRSQGFHDLLVGAISRREKCKDACDLFEYCCGSCSDGAIIEGGLDKIPAFSCYCFKKIFKHVYDATLKLIEDKTDLDTLNPAAKRTLIDCFTIEDDVKKEK